jgi:hypothetical protein
VRRADAFDRLRILSLAVFNVLRLVQNQRVKLKLSISVGVPTD